MAHRDLIEAHVERIVVGTQAIEIRLTNIPQACRMMANETAHNTVLTIPWITPATIAVKGLLHAPTPRGDNDVR